MSNDHTDVLFQRINDDDDDDVLPDCLHGLLPAPFLLNYSDFDFYFFIIYRFWAVR